MSLQQRFPSFLKDQRDYFDQLISEEWDTYLSEEWDEFRRYEVAKLFEVVQPRTILDVGCGCGFHDLEMAKFPFVGRIDAIDYSQKSIDRAEREYPHEKVHRQVADFTEFRPSVRYELIVSFQVFEHLHNPGEYLAFCRDYTTADGRMAIFTPNRWRADNLWRLASLRRPLLCDPQHFTEYSARHLVRLARPYGFVHRATLGLGWPEAGGPGLTPRPLAERLRLGAKWPFAASNIGVIMRRSA